MHQRSSSKYLQVFSSQLFPSCKLFLSFLLDFRVPKILIFLKLWQFLPASPLFLWLLLFYNGKSCPRSQNIYCLIFKRDFSDLYSGNQYIRSTQKVFIYAYIDRKWMEEQKKLYLYFRGRLSNVNIYMHLSKQHIKT